MISSSCHFIVSIYVSSNDTISYCGPFEYRGGKLSRVNFPGGYISGDSACHYIRDHQGNVRQVVSAATGTVVQENCYYPGGTLFGESTSSFFRHGSATGSNLKPMFRLNVSGRLRNITIQMSRIQWSVSE